MLKQFYEKALATQGVYCVTGIEPGEAGKAKVVNKFAEDVDGVLKHIDFFNNKSI
jgi:hypothetical protein